MVTGRLLKAVYAVHNGVYAMSQDIPDWWRHLLIWLLSSRQTEDKDCDKPAKCHFVLSQGYVRNGRSAFMLGGAEVTTGEGYPGWKPNPSSPILKVAVDNYKLFVWSQ